MGPDRERSNAEFTLHNFDPDFQVIFVGLNELLDKSSRSEANQWFGARKSALERYA